MNTIYNYNKIMICCFMLALLTLPHTVLAQTLPQGAGTYSQTPDENPELEIIELTAEGVVYYNSVTVSMEELKADLASLDAATSFLIRADRDVRLQVFVDVADVLKQLSFSKVAVQIKVEAL